MEIKKHQLIFGLLFIGVMAFSACQKGSSDTSLTNKPVVVGYITPNQPITVKIYQQKGLSDTATYGAAITGLKPTITDGTQTITLTETTSGVYTYSTTTFLTAGKTYTLNFTYLNSAISAQTVMPTKPVNYTATKTTINLPATSGTPNSTDSVATTFRWSNPDSLYHLLVFKNDDTSPYQISTRNNPLVNFTTNVNKTAEYQMYYKSFNYLGIYRAILMTVNKEYINVLNSATANNSSSQNLVNIPTNVNNGLGIFTAIQADTIKLTITQY